MELDWDKAPAEATHYDSKWDQWMWLDRVGDWLSYSEGVQESGWNLCSVGQSLIDEYFIAKPVNT